MSSGFIRLPAEFKNDRIFVCPVTEEGYRLDFYTDTGGGGIMIKPDVAKLLNLPVVRKEFEKEEYLFVPFPKFQEDASIPSGTWSDELMVYSDIPWGQGFLGQSWFANRIWLLDYLNNEMGYSDKDSDFNVTGFQSTPIGFKHDDNGIQQPSFPRIQAKIDGEWLDFLFDTGATVHLTNEALDILGNGDGLFRGACFITKSQYDKWRAKHPEWTVIEHADRFGNQDMIQVPCVEVAGLQSGKVWFTARPDSNFHEFMSQGMDNRIEGALGGSLFKYFSIIIDYRKSTAYFKR